VVNAYEVCRFVRRYQAKNGYAPKRSELSCTNEEVEVLIKNGVLEALPLFDGGTPIAVCLTDKGLRMAQAPVKRR
jgi:hypothetical protein